MLTKTAAQLNEEVYCRLKPSSLHGIGVFAIRPIPKNTVYNKYWNDTRGKKCRILTREWEDVSPEIKDMILASGLFTELDEYYYIEHPNLHHCLFVNHAEHPNTHKGKALRDIAVGEEITRYCNGIHYEVVKHFAGQGIIINNDI